eukprot:3206985-Heterocapsa_arctica.AAC.1
MERVVFPDIFLRRYTARITSRGLGPAADYRRSRPATNPRYAGSAVVNISLSSVSAPMTVSFLPEVVVTIARSMRSTSCEVYSLDLVGKVSRQVSVQVKCQYAADNTYEISDL